MGFSYPTMLLVFVCVVAVYSNYVTATIDSYDCTGDEFLCGLSGECIPKLWVCDRIADCSGREDEIRCCSSDMFNCMSGRCIDFEKVCDGTRDCDQGDDERECAVDACREDEFTCPNSGNCIPKDWECDFFNDCPDREDELNCCPDDQFTCNNGRCIPLSMVCDGYDECDDGKDELDEHCNYCATDENICHENATCLGVPGSFKCECKDGFNGDGLSCNDIDECSYHTDDCDTDATCTNTQGGYTCECNTGYSGNGTHCLDIDECMTDANYCRHYEHTTCISRPGSFACGCMVGYHGDWFSCSDIDECRDNSHSCHHFASCTNIQGSYTCRCDNGYRGDGVSCTDIDECEVGLDNCHHNATCMNQFGDFLCECNHGYRGDGKTCVDIDECAENTHNCDVLGTCVNTEGSYECECHDGLELGDDGFSCQDIDECDTDTYQPTHNCHVFATCTNTFGLYECECEQGFRGNGYECSDINECVDFNDCSPFASCTNSIGSYICWCDRGYIGDGKTCEPYVALPGYLRLVGGININEGAVEILTDSTWSPICDNSWDDLDAEVVCRQLGLPHGLPMAVRGSWFGPVPGPAVMDYVGCVGNEDNLRNCDHRKTGMICGSNEQAGVVCTDHSNVRLADITETSFTTKGRVQIMKNGIWGNICDNNWDDLDAKVVCRQLGLPYEHARSYDTPVSASQISELFAMDFVECDGDEHDLLKCSHSSRAQRSCDFASVICSDGLQIDEKPDLFDTDICGTRAGIGGRVAGGQDARPLSWPWAAAMLVDMMDGRIKLCAASLINEDWAVTAAHCIVGYQRLTLLFGDTSFDGQGGVVRTAAPICHPDYNMTLGYAFDNDICLLKLDANVTFNQYVRPVCLSVSQEEQTTYGSCYVAGWGLMREGENNRTNRIRNFQKMSDDYVTWLDQFQVFMNKQGPYANDLQELATNLLSKTECEQIYPDRISDKMICSASGSEPSACQGDSGGPLMCQSGHNKWHLVGVTSSGHGCGVDGTAAVSTRVSRYTRWIYKVVSGYGSE